MVIQACVLDHAYDPVDSSVSLCLGHSLRTSDEAVVNLAFNTDISTCTKIAWEQINTNRLGMADLK